MPDEQTADRPPEPMTEGPDETDQPQDDLARALAEGPLDWPEDDTPPPPDPQLKGIGLPPERGPAARVRTSSSCREQHDQLGPGRRAPSGSSTINSARDVGLLRGVARSTRPGTSGCFGE